MPDLRFAVVVLVAVSVGGCDDGLLDALPQAQNLAVCVIPDGGWDQAPGNETVELSLSGMVVERGAGPVPNGCFEPPLVGWGGSSSAAQWLRLEDGGQRWTVGVVMDGFAAPPAGAEVSLSLSHAHGAFGPAFGNFVLNDGGGTRAWLALGGDIGDLVLPPPIEAVRQGKVVYRENDDCGTWEAYEIEVNTATDVVVLEYGERESEDDAVLFHGGFVHDTGGKTSCSDWFVADLRMGWRRD